MFKIPKGIDRQRVIIGRSRLVAAVLVIVTVMGVENFSVVVSGATARTTILKTETFGGYSIRLPSEWPDRSSAQCLVGHGISAKTLHGPAIVIGTSTSLFRYGSECVAIRPKGVVVVLGYSGPPAPPVPSFPIATRKLNGVTVQLYGARSRHDRAVYFLALLPSRSQWVLVSMPLQSALKARDEIWSLLSTLRPVTQRAKEATPPSGVFRGTWTGAPGLSLDISSEGGTMIGTLRGKTYESPTEVIEISLKRRARDELDGVVSNVRFVNAHGRTVTEPVDLDDYPVGDRFRFMFLSKNILEVILSKGRMSFGPMLDTSYFCHQTLVSPTVISNFNC
jgi:hypothetical protein